MRRTATRTLDDLGSDGLDTLVTVRIPGAFDAQDLTSRAVVPVLLGGVGVGRPCRSLAGFDIANIGRSGADAGAIRREAGKISRR
jgi:hypothetical protein